MHEGRNPYQCSLCEVTFRHASQLSLHKKKHKLAIIAWRDVITIPLLTQLLTSSGDLDINPVAREKASGSVN